MKLTAYNAVVQAFYLRKGMGVKYGQIVNMYVLGHMARHYTGQQKFKK